PGRAAPHAAAAPAPPLLGARRRPARVVGRPLPRRRGGVRRPQHARGASEPRTAGAGAVSDAVEVNGRRYRRPAARTAVVCLGGCGPAYLEDAFGRQLVPRLAELAEQGVGTIGRSQLPSFTNPNNLSIVTGAPPAVHGLPGNHYLAPSGEEVQLT